MARSIVRSALSEQATFPRDTHRPRPSTAEVTRRNCRRVIAIAVSDAGARLVAARRASLDQLAGRPAMGGSDSGTMRPARAVPLSRLSVDGGDSVSGPGRAMG